MNNILDILEDVAKAPNFMGGNPKYMYHTKSEEPFMKDINDIKQALTTAESDNLKIKCWDIAIKKEVKLGMLRTCKTVAGYNAGCRIFDADEKNQLTEEEFDILKEGIRRTEI